MGDQHLTGEVFVACARMREFFVYTDEEEHGWVCCKKCTDQEDDKTENGTLIHHQPDHYSLLQKDFRPTGESRETQSFAEIFS